MCKLGYQNGKNFYKKSPFAYYSELFGQMHKGGKPDDVSVGVSSVGYF